MQDRLYFNQCTVGILELKHQAKGTKHKGERLMEYV